METIKAKDGTRNAMDVIKYLEGIYSIESDKKPIVIYCSDDGLFINGIIKVKRDDYDIIFEGSNKVDDGITEKELLEQIIEAYEEIRKEEIEIMYEGEDPWTYASIAVPSDDYIEMATIIIGRTTDGRLFLSNPEAMNKLESYTNIIKLITGDEQQ